MEMAAHHLVVRQNTHRAVLINAHHPPPLGLGLSLVFPLAAEGGGLYPLIALLAKYFDFKKNYHYTIF